MESAYSLLILNLADNVLRQIDDEDTATKVWLKLESLFMTKTLSNKIYLKEQLFGFKMDPYKSLDDNLDEFKKITITLANIDEKIFDKNQVIILLNFLPKSFKDLKSTIKYGRDSLTLEDVLEALNSRELKIKSEKKSNSKGLFSRGRTNKRRYSCGRRTSNSSIRRNKSNGRSGFRSQSHGPQNKSTRTC